MTDYVAVLLLAFCVAGLRCEVASTFDHTPARTSESSDVLLQHVLSLIEDAVKIGKFTKMDEKRNSLILVKAHVNAIEDIVQSMESTLPPIDETTDSMKPTITESTEGIASIYDTDCEQLRSRGFKESGMYNIYPRYPDSTEPLEVYCDQVAGGGGWIVFQRRKDGSVSFERTWDEYRDGFGDTSGEFWLGNDNLVLLTTTPSGGSVELRVDIVDWANGTAFAQYDNFAVRGDIYTLTVEGYNQASNAGDSLTYHNRRAFTTVDRDNDGATSGNCAKWLKSGWWHATVFCIKASLNGPYLYPGGRHGALSPIREDGVLWPTYNPHGYVGRYYSLKGVEMKLRRVPSSLP